MHVLEHGDRGSSQPPLLKRVKCTNTKKALKIISVLANEWSVFCLFYQETTLHPGEKLPTCTLMGFPTILL